MTHRDRGTWDHMGSLITRLRIWCDTQARGISLTRGPKAGNWMDRDGIWDQFQTISLGPRHCCRSQLGLESLRMSVFLERRWSHPSRPVQRTGVTGRACHVFSCVFAFVLREGFMLYAWVIWTPFVPQPGLELVATLPAPASRGLRLQAWVPPPSACFPLFY